MCLIFLYAEPMIKNCHTQLIQTKKVACLLVTQARYLNGARYQNYRKKNMTKLTPNQLALLSEILTQYCEDCDSSATTAHLVDQIWEKIYNQNSEAAA